MNATRFALLLALLAAVLYAATWSPLVTWAHFGEDGPELEAAGRTLGVAHPTGYPLFTLLVRVTSLVVPIPVSAVNVVTLLGAMAAVAATGLLGRIVIRGAFPDSPGAAWAGGALAAGFLATSLTFWRQASIGEVYTIHLALAAAVLALVFRGTPRSRILAAYLLGLAVGHHLLALPLALLVAAYGLSVHPGRPRPATLLAFTVPLTLVLVLLVRSGRDPTLDWGNPESLPGLWWSVSGTPYRGNLFEGGWAGVAERAAAAVSGGPAAQLGWGVSCLREPDSGSPSSGSAPRDWC